MRLGGDGHRVNTRTELAAALDTAFTRRWRLEPIELLLPGDCDQNNAVAATAACPAEARSAGMAAAAWVGPSTAEAHSRSAS